MKHLQDSIKYQTRLERENQLLTKEIQELSAEVASSRSYIDKLLKTSRDTKQSDWEEKEQQYKAIVRNLRQRLVKENTMVSIDLYKAAIDSGRQKMSELKQSQQRVASLSSKVSELKNELKKNAVENPKTSEQVGGVSQVGFGSPTDFLEKGLLRKSSIEIESFNVGRVRQESEQLRVHNKLRTDDEHNSPVSHKRHSLVSQVDAIFPEQRQYGGDWNQLSERPGENRASPFIFPATGQQESNGRTDVNRDKLHSVSKPVAKPLGPGADEDGILTWVDNYAASMQKYDHCKESRVHVSKKVGMIAPPQTDKIVREGGQQNGRVAREGNEARKVQKEKCDLNKLENNVKSASAVRPQPQSENKPTDLRVDKKGNCESPDDIMRKPDKAYARHKKRSAVLAAAGGRKGLEDQLRKLRSPPCRGRVPFRQVN